MTSLALAFEDVRLRLDEAVRAGGVDAIAHGVKAILESSLRGPGLQLEDRFYQPLPDRYARRLLHRDPDNRYTAVVMTWGPGQKTPLHDHAGIWCVECVVTGHMEVIQYDLIAENAGTYAFSERTRVAAARGAAGCLIPPFEYHTLGNGLDDRTSVTLHVYGGEMDHCHIFEPVEGGRYRRLARKLRYND
jgi:predicted metal-dependent enzyme (double-stranded beta helix superfamily)